MNKNDVVAAFGVVGNFTGHLEQAGEAKDFVALNVAQGRPKGLFPIYVPGGQGPLSHWPFSDSVLALPEMDADIQPEPEMALRCRLSYDAGGVSAVLPEACAAFDDTSIRRPSFPKLSMKKNWGANSKGLASTWLPVDDFSSNGAVAHFRLTCFLIRNGSCILYGEDSAVRDYSTIYGELLEWMTDRFRNQEDAGPLENLKEWLERAGRPETAIISIGATRYTEEGTGNFVHAGDEIVTVVYDGRAHSTDLIQKAISDGTAKLEHTSILRRRVI